MGGHPIRNSPGGGDVEPSNRFWHAIRREALRPASEDAVPSQPGPGVEQQTGHEDERSLDLQARLDLVSRAETPLDVLDPPRLSSRWFSDMAEIQIHSAAVERRFQDVTVECDEEGYDVPPDDVIEETRRIVNAMLRMCPREYDIYPMDDRRIAVEVDGGFGRRMLLLCEAGRTAICIVTVDRVSRRARYEDSSILPDGFITDALRDMGSEVGTFLNVGVPSGLRGIHDP